MENEERRKQMIIKKVTAEESLKQFKAGNDVFVLMKADMNVMSVADLLTMDLIVEVPDGKSVDANSAGGVKPISRKVIARSWTGARSRLSMMPGGLMKRSQMRWAAPCLQS